MSTPPSPSDLARARGIEPSEGPSGDGPVDTALATLDDAVLRFTADGTTVVDAEEVLVAGHHLHDVLQHRLTEAQG